MSVPPVFDRPLVWRQQRRARRLGPATFLLDRVVADAADRLAAILRPFDTVVDLGTPEAALGRALAQSGRIGPITAIAHVADALAAYGGPAIVADEEMLPLREFSIDLIVSGLSLQTVNDLPGVFVQIRRALRPDGLFLAALLGGETLSELRQSFAIAEAELEGGVSPRVAPFADVRDVGALLQRAGFALPVTDIDRLTVRYASAFALMHDLRRMGAGNSLSERRRTPLRRATLMRMAEVYAERFADPDGRIRATFEIVWLAGWAPQASSGRSGPAARRRGLPMR